jgi:hypothetical protein
MLGITQFGNKASSWKTTTSGILDAIGSVGLYGTLINDVIQIASHAEAISTHPAVLIFSALLKIGAKIALGLSAKDNDKG